MTPSSELRRAATATMLTSFPGSDLPPWLLRRVEEGAGGVCLYGSNRDADFGGVSATLRRARPDVLVACDEEGGDVTRLEALVGSSVPGNAALGAIDDVVLTREVAAALGGALIEVGIDLDLAPCADVNSNPANPVVGVRSFGSDPDLVARHTAAFVEGLHDAGVAACAKHFPGHGAVDVDSHLDLPRLDVSSELLQSRELVPFRAAIAAGVDAVMPGHLVVPHLDDRPATVSALIVDGLLRGLGFSGVVLTDALDMGGIGGPDLIPDNVVAALAAGADMCCLGPDNGEELFDACVDAVLDAVASGTLPEARVHDAAERIGHLRRGRTTRPSGPLREIGAEAARRALRVAGLPDEPLVGAHVLELDRPQNIAAGAVPWGVGEPLRRIDPSVVVTRVGPDDVSRLAGLVTAAVGRPLVLVVRDVHRVPELAAATATVLERRPDAVVVDMGWPTAAGEPTSGPPAQHICTYGASRASGEVVAALLAGNAPAAQPSLRRSTDG